MRSQRTFARAVGTALAITILIEPAAAVHGPLECSVPNGLQPLFDLLDAFIHLALYLGLALGTFGLIVAGILFQWPGQDTTRRGKQVAQNVIIGTIILLSAAGIIQFITSKMAGTLCG